MQDKFTTKVKFIGVILPNKEGNKNITTFPIIKGHTHQIIATDKPLSTKFVQNTISQETDSEENKEFLNSQYNAKIFQYDCVYDEITIISLYQEQIRDSVNSCLLGKNNSILIFGLSSFDTDQLLLDNQGILVKTLEEMFHLRSTHVEKRVIDLSVAVYLNVNDRIYDLLSESPSSDHNNPKAKNISYPEEIGELIQKSYEMKTRVVDNLGVMAKSTDIVFSIRLNKYSTVYSKYDFIILAASEFGLDSKDSNFNNLIYNNFNAIGNHLYSSALGIDQTEDSALTKTLGDSISKNSNSILFVNCLVSNLYPNSNNIKSLQFTNWIRNQIMENRTKDIKLQNANETAINEGNLMGYNPRYTNGSVSKQYNYDKEHDFNFNYGSSYNPKSSQSAYDYQSSLLPNEYYKSKQSYAYNKTLNQLYKSCKTIPKSEEASPEHNNFEENQFDSKMAKLKKSKDEIKESLSQNPKIEKLEKTVEQLIKRNEELEKNLSSIREAKPLNDSKIVNLENENMKQELVVLRNDNLILREDVNRLCELNSTLEGDLDIVRRKK